MNFRGNSFARVGPVRNFLPYPVTPSTEYYTNIIEFYNEGILIHKWKIQKKVLFLELFKTSNLKRNERFCSHE